MVICTFSELTWDYLTTVNQNYNMDIIVEKYNETTAPLR